MSEATHQGLSGVPETLFIPLYNRAMESQRPDAMMKDEKAVELVRRMRADEDIRYDFDRVTQVPMTEANRVVRIMLTREMDRYVQDFLRRHPDAVVVQVGCGLDSRFERVDNGLVVWYDLDLPEVIELRRKLIGGDGGRYHLLNCSVLEDAWLETVKVHAQHPFLFLAEAVFVYFTEAQARSLVLTLRDHFRGAELVFDGWTPFYVWLANLQISPSKFAGLLQWGFRHGKEIEGWGEGIHLLDVWGFLDRPEPRLARSQWMRYVPPLARSMRVFHFQLGKTGGQHVRNN